MEDKIGIGMLTHKRFDYCKRSLKALIKSKFGGADYFILIEDGFDYNEEQVQELIDIMNASEFPCDYIRQPNGGVATAKNNAIKNCMLFDCDHIFLIEDDILMMDEKTCLKYIDYARQVTKYTDMKIHHMNFAHHGPANVNGEHNYNGIKVYPHCVGAFSYYTKEVLDKVGLMDENFKNVWDHVENSYRIAKAGYTTPFWHFIDHPKSKEMLVEIPGSIDYSSIRPKDDWKENIIKGKLYWINKHGDWMPKYDSLGNQRIKDGN